MTCGIDKWLSGTWHSCIFDPVTGLVGEGVFGLVIGSAIWAAMYFGGGGNPTTPTVVVILFATLLFPILPEAYLGIAWTILLVGGVGVAIQGLQKYVLSPATQ